MKTYLLVSTLSICLALLACKQKAEEKAAKSELDSLKQTAAFQTAKAKEENEAFLAKNKTNEGVMTTESGLQYSVLQLAEGDKPIAGDKAVVSVVGILINGTEFQNSAKSGAPDTIAVSGAIAGIAEALQLMSKGSKFKVFVPSSLAYGEKGSDDKKIGPHATLIYEIELLSIIKAAPKKPAGLSAAKKAKRAEKLKKLKETKKKGAIKR